MNIELAQNNHQQFKKIKKILKKALKCINGKISKKSLPVVDQYQTEIDDNKFNEMLERRMEEQQNLLNEQIYGQQEGGSCFVETEHGKFYWSSDINQFVAVDRDLIESKFCLTSSQQPQMQCC